VRNLAPSVRFFPSPPGPPCCAALLQELQGLPPLPGRPCRMDAFDADCKDVARGLHLCMTARASAPTAWVTFSFKEAELTPAPFDPSSVSSWARGHGGGARRRLLGGR